MSAADSLEQIPADVGVAPLSRTVRETSRSGCAMPRPASRTLTPHARHECADVDVGSLAGGTTRGSTAPGCSSSARSIY